MRGASFGVMLYRLEYFLVIVSNGKSLCPTRGRQESNAGTKPRSAVLVSVLETRSKLQKKFATIQENHLEKDFSCQLQF